MVKCQMVSIILNNKTENKIKICSSAENTLSDQLKYLVINQACVAK